MEKNISVDVDNEDLNESVAREVFGLFQEQIDAWPWSVPPFSSDRNYAAGIVSRLWEAEATRKALEKALTARLPSLHGGIAEILMVATPRELCRAALSAVRECSVTA